MIIAVNLSEVIHINFTPLDKNHPTSFREEFLLLALIIYVYYISFSLFRHLGLVLTFLQYIPMDLYFASCINFMGVTMILDIRCNK